MITAPRTEFVRRASRTVPLALALTAGSLLLPASAASLPVANFSFELPVTTFVDTRIDSWTKTPQPDWFQPQGGVTWDQTSGVFANTAPGAANHIVNMEGSQAVYLFGLPQAGFSQVLGSTFEAGLQYTLTLGVLGGGNIAEGTSLLVGLFYVDAAGAPVTVAASTVTYSKAGFPTSTVLLDQQAVSGVLQAGDASVGKNIGIQIVGTSGDGAGYWDLDNVRVTASAVPEPGMWALMALGLGGLVAVRHRMSSRP